MNQFIKKFFLLTGFQLVVFITMVLCASFIRWDMTILKLIVGDWLLLRAICLSSLFMAAIWFFVDNQ